MKQETLDILAKILERVPRSDNRRDVTRHTTLRNGFLQGKMQFSQFLDVCERGGIDFAEAIGREIERIDFIRIMREEDAIIEALDVQEQEKSDFFAKAPCEGEFLIPKETEVETLKKEILKLLNNLKDEQE